MNQSVTEPEDGLARHLEHILESLPAGVVVLDGAGYVQLCNPAAEELLGTPLIGVLWRDVITRSFTPRIDDGHEVSLRDGRRVSIATRALVNDEPGQLLLIKDVTQTRLLQERLNHHERLLALGEMMASLAHQIRTPLAAALLYGSYLKRADLSNADRQHCTAKLVARLQHMERLIQNMLSFARRGSFALEPLNLSALLQEFSQHLELPLAEAGANLQLETLPEAWVNGDREALLTVLGNLVNNALQACGKGGELTLALLPAGEVDAYDIVLTDNGPGIPTALQDRIFEPFFTTRPNGSGLGLAVVRAIVKAHEGAVWVESNPAKGCRFFVRLPRTLPSMAS
jgi:two-component system sensor histidine kinase FlrB